MMSDSALLGGPGVVGPGGDGTTTTTTPALLATSLYALRAELLAILSELRWITSKLKDDSEDGSATSDWKFVAMVIDRLCFWVFAVYYVLGSIVIFMRAPNVFA